MTTDALRGRVAVVTGASRGIGRAIALMLGSHGVKVAAAARTDADLRAVCDDIAGHGGEATPVCTDMTSEEGVKRLVRTTVERLGKLDIVINNAGIGVFGPIEETATEDWDRVMAVNVRGAFILCREAIPHLRQNDGTTWIINICSVVGVKGYVNQAAYTASKHALLGMTKVLAQEVQKDGIRVHAVCPGGVDTGLVAAARPDLDRSVLMRPEEIAEIVLFLLTRQGNAVVDQINVRRAASQPWW
ncbi:MAG TPA: SDR family oxidoreductase [Candidatus Hydrogenedentes bacterium]|nr:SDR family oxidoreductase [Candidatus Hydrogenedentota bacterium]